MQTHRFARLRPPSWPDLRSPAAAHRPSAPPAEGHGQVFCCSASGRAVDPHHQVVALGTYLYSRLFFQPVLHGRYRGFGHIGGSRYADVELYRCSAIAKYFYTVGNGFIKALPGYAYSGHSIAFCNHCCSKWRIAARIFYCHQCAGINTLQLSLLYDKRAIAGPAVYLQQLALWQVTAGKYPLRTIAFHHGQLLLVFGLYHTLYRGKQLLVRSIAGQLL